MSLNLLCLSRLQRSFVSFPLFRPVKFPSASCKSVNISRRCKVVKWFGQSICNSIATNHAAFGLSFSEIQICLLVTMQYAVLTSSLLHWMYYAQAMLQCLDTALLENGIHFLTRELSWVLKSVTLTVTHLQPAPLWWVYMGWPLRLLLSFLKEMLHMCLPDNRDRCTCDMHLLGSCGKRRRRRIEGAGRKSKSSIK